MTEININIENCNNIDNALIDIQSNKLNIKYGINGTGKSTIVRAIEIAAGGQGDLKELLPFKHRANPDKTKQPNVSGLDQINLVKVFNEGYVNQFLFTQDEVVKNSFEIFIKTTEYDQKMKEIDNLVAGIKDTFKDDEKLDQVIQDLADLSASFGNSTSGVHGSSKMMKAISSNPSLTNIPEKLDPYKSFLRMSDNKNVKWLGWHNGGEEFLEISDDCPYCTSPSADKKDTIRSLKEEYNPTNIKHLNEILNITRRLGAYFTIEANQKIQTILDAGNISEEFQGFLVEIKTQIDRLKARLTSLRDISFFTFKDNNEAQETINEFKIDLSFYCHLESEITKETVDRINQSLTNVESQIGKLQGQIAQQKQSIQKTILKHTSDINDFLKYAGYKYQVEIEENTYKMRLLHTELGSHVEHSKNHLSFGERNAFALVLFMYQCLSEKPDLIILDDPISSFDKNKKYAITSKLFRKPSNRESESLQGKTVLMVTHDIEPIIDIVHTFHRDFFTLSSVKFLENRNGSVSEISIEKEDIKSFGSVCQDNIRRVQDVIIRCVYLRRYYEILDHYSSEYHVLSSLLKKRTHPSFDREENNLIPEEKIINATAKIKPYIPDFDYALILQQLSNEQEMLQRYINASNNYEKLQLYRIIKQGATRTELHSNDVIRKFINEAFHVETEYIMQLDPSKYSPVPQYIIDECDKSLEEIVTTT